MKPVLFVVALSLWGLVGLNQAAAENVVAANPPTIELVGTNCVDLGSIPNYEYQLVKFVFRNPGTMPVEIQRVVSSCPCIRGYPQTAILQPKEEATINVELNGTAVHAAFERRVWVETSDKKQPRITLTVRGDVRPMFNGFPESPYAFRVRDVNATVTNRFTITATETNLFVGVPSVFGSNSVMSATASFAAKNAADKTNASYDVTLVMTSRAAGRRSVFLDIPVQGQGRTNLPPYRLTITGYVSTELRLSQTQELVVPPGEGNTLLRHLRIRLSESDANPALLAWSPQREGVSITTAVAPKPKPLNGKKEKEPYTSFLVTIGITSKAAAQLIAEKDSVLTFSYPNYKPSALHFVTSLPEENDKEEKEEEAPENNEKN